MCGLTGEEVTGSKLGLVEECFSDCNPLIIITPPELALSEEVHDGTKVMGLGSKLDVSTWVQHRILGLVNWLGFLLVLMSGCIAHLQRLEREMEENNLLERKATVNRKVVTPTSRGKRELRNLISSVNYDGW